MGYPRWTPLRLLKSPRLSACQCPAECDFVLHTAMSGEREYSQMPIRKRVPWRELWCSENVPHAWQIQIQILGALASLKLLSTADLGAATQFLQAVCPFIAHTSKGCGDELTKLANLAACTAARYSSCGCHLAAEVASKQQHASTSDAATDSRRSGGVLPWLLVSGPSGQRPPCPAHHLLL